MKIYTFELNLNEPVDKAFWVAPQSDYKIGVKVLENGNTVSASSVKLYDGSSEVVADGNLTNNFKTFTKKSGNEGVKVYDVKVNGVVKFKIKETTSNSTVYDVDAQGSYTLPVATSTTLGGVKIGTGITVDSAGKISASGGAPNIIQSYSDGSGDDVVTISEFPKKGDFLMLWNDTQVPVSKIKYGSNTYILDEISGLSNIKCNRLYLVKGSNSTIGEFTLISTSEAQATPTGIKFYKQ